MYTMLREMTPLKVRRSERWPVANHLEVYETQPPTRYWVDYDDQRYKDRDSEMALPIQSPNKPLINTTVLNYQPSEPNTR
jgi:hypothetical protein